MKEKLEDIFHIEGRGSTIKREVWAGIGAFLIAVCALLINTQMIGAYYGNYAGAYFAISVVAFLATTVIGIVTNLPVMQSASLSMSTLMVTYMGTETGLTYENLLMVTFVSAVISLVIVISPLKKVFVDALPEGIKKAFPVGVGLYVILVSLQKAGLISSEGVIGSVKALSEMDNVYLVIMLAGILLFALYVAVGRKNPLGSTYLMMIGAMWVIGIVFFMENFVGGQTATTLVYQRVNLIVATDGASPYTIASGVSSLNIGGLFARGFDFSAYTEGGGNAAMFIIQSVLTFTLLGLYTNIGVTKAAAAEAGIDGESEVEAGTKKAAVVSAASNVLSALLGAAPQTIGVESMMEARDGGRTGLTSVVAGIGYLISLFTWAFFAIMATTTNGVGMWINDTETKLAAYVQDGFVFASFIMIILGCLMIKGVSEVEFSDKREWIPFVITVVVAGFSGNLILGAAIAGVSYFILTLFSENKKELDIPFIVVCVVLLIYGIITLYYGGDFVTPVNNMMMGGPPM